MRLAILVVLAAWGLLVGYMGAIEPTIWHGLVVATVVLLVTAGGLWRTLRPWGER